MSVYSNYYFLSPIGSVHETDSDTILSAYLKGEGEGGELEGHGKTVFLFVLLVLVCLRIHHSYSFILIPVLVECAESSMSHQVIVRGVRLTH